MTWLSLSLLSFMALMTLIIFEARWVFPDIQAYFSQSGNLTGQQLATRSRHYLQNAQERLLDVPGPEARAQAITDIELAYGLFDVDIYHQRYACTAASLGVLDETLAALEADSALPVVLARELFNPINCLTEIEMGQLDQRGEVITEFADRTGWHHQVLIYSSVLIFFVGLLFWWLHERQLRRAEKATQETLTWMERAMQDPLTGIGNRSALHQDVMQQQSQSLGLVLVDIDFFKQYNDAMGHPAGDTLLRQLAQLIANALTDEATLYRLGGDEFAALLPCEDAATLEAYCQKLHRQVQQSEFTHVAHPDKKQVTLSIGATCFVASESGFASAYAAADKALYQVKTSGRDNWRIIDVA
ncbi:GGDEF domain-containing protein [Halomonas sp. CUBES01]|uniref:diguanylate cyclase n=1 Tax=Vreelandella gomseomensis TaxID=370766 RepID=A0ABU1G9A9_9GAMM|nr:MULTISPECIES: GGDEF domain-containing protein [Halomonas]MDR5874083.1 GGDEF domain-containing protein [Halomonas gomseomensis]MEC4767160.1 GGDEF domain-containing protein [Halomonas sp. CUBES01]